ncbi:MAG: hypothetical protein P4L43_06555 [Syntrophobacteraceae bacterium]|nr:hypothetical protein [Syntrophobacteraceae bacterium]
MTVALQGEGRLATQGPIGPFGKTKLRICGNRGVTPDTAFRLSGFFGTTIDFWMRLQADIDMWDTLSTHGSEYGRIRPVARASNE